MQIMWKIKMFAVWQDGGYYSYNVKQGNKGKEENIHNSMLKTEILRNKPIIYQIHPHRYSECNKSHKTNVGEEIALNLLLSF